MSEPEKLPCLRVQLCLKKKDDVTDEFFHEYWKGNHVKLALENKKFADHVIRYNQVPLLATRLQTMVARLIWRLVSHVASPQNSSLEFQDPGTRV